MPPLQCHGLPLSVLNAEHVNVEFIEKVQELFRPHRYKVLVGGRGSLKSWSIARALLLEASSNPYRYLCAREVQNSIRESVHQLLSDQIELLGMGQRFEILETEIYGRDVRSQFLYTGLAKQTKESIKSYERINRVWVEEAQKVSKRSWDILLPTIRVPGSEIWMSLNPDLETDETYVRFVVSPPPGALVVHLNFRDNPWLTPELAMEEQVTRSRSKEDHDNIWGGKPRSAAEGAVYQREVSDLISQGRYAFSPYDPRFKVHTIWDMGWNIGSIILAQRSTTAIYIIGYLEGTHIRTDEWAALLNRMPLNWGWDWLPHDGHATERKTGTSDYQILVKARRRVKIRDPKTEVSEELGVRMLRQAFPRLYVHKGGDELVPAEYRVTGTQIPALPGLQYHNTARLVECWKRYRYAIPKHGEPQHPISDEYEHACDATRILATIAEQLTNDDEWTGRTTIPRGIGFGVSADTGMGALG